MKARTVPLRQDHLPPMLDWLGDEDLRDHIGTVWPIGPVQHEAWYRALAGDRTRVVLAIETTDPVAHVGTIGLSGVDLVYRTAELWVYIGAPSVRGTGVAREAVQQVLHFGFGTLGLHRIMVQVFGFNERAQKFFRGCGFVAEGILREAVFKRGRFHDKHVLSMLDREFPDAG